MIFRSSKQMNERRNEQTAGKTSNCQSLCFSTGSLLCLFALFVFLAVAPAFGATLDEYRGKIQNVRNIADELLYQGNTNSTEKSAAKIARLRRELPVTENVEWRGGAVQTDNKWLQDRLDEFEKEQDQARRRTILSGIKERLLAIEQKIGELENPSVSNRTKDEEKRKLSEILKREEYQKPEQQQESFIQRLLRKIKEWFSREAPDAPKIPEGASSSFSAVSQILQILLYVLIFAVVGFLIYKFLPFAAKRFKNREKREKKERVILGERIAEGDSSENIFSEAERLAREGNLRGAIRKGYIALLCELNDKKIIGLAQHKTNRDYLRDVRKKPELHENMNGLTVNFERHWYGFEETEETDWEEFRQGYLRTVGSSSRQ